MTNKGELFDQNPLKATGDKSKQTTLVPLKKGKEVWKYGGYNSITPSYFMLVESKDKKGNYIRTIETMPLYREKEFSKNEEFLLNYCKEVHKLKEPKIILKCIKKNSLLIVDGFPMHLKGSTGLQLKLQGAVQLILESDMVIYLKKLMKFVKLLII
jgi:CRISPR-associated endonuclease Csn1